MTRIKACYIILPPMGQSFGSNIYVIFLTFLEEKKNYFRLCSWTEMCMVPAVERQAAELWTVPAAVDFQQTMDYSSKPDWERERQSS